MHIGVPVLAERPPIDGKFTRRPAGYLMHVNAAGVRSASVCNEDNDFNWSLERPGQMSGLQKSGGYVPSVRLPSLRVRSDWSDTVHSDISS